MRNATPIQALQLGADPVRLSDILTPFMFLQFPLLYRSLTTSHIT